MALTQSQGAPGRIGRRPRRLWSRLHFTVRFLGLTGLLAACVGLVLSHQGGLLASWDKAAAALTGLLSGGGAMVGVYLILAGVGFTLLDLLVEALVVLRMMAGRRSAVGVNAVVQIALALVLFVA